MKLHRHIIRANAMFDKVELLVRDMDRAGDERAPVILEYLETIRGDLNHIDRKLAAFNRIVLDVLTSE